MSSIDTGLNLNNSSVHNSAVSHAESKVNSFVQVQQVKPCDDVVEACQTDTDKTNVHLLETTKDLSKSDLSKNADLLVEGLTKILQSSNDKETDSDNTGCVKSSSELKRVQLENAVCEPPLDKTKSINPVYPNLVEKTLQDMGLKKGSEGGLTSMIAEVNEIENIDDHLKNEEIHGKVKVSSTECPKTNVNLRTACADNKLSDLSNPSLARKEVEQSVKSVDNLATTTQSGRSENIVNHRVLQELGTSFESSKSKTNSPSLSEDLSGDTDSCSQSASIEHSEIEHSANKTKMAPAVQIVQVKGQSVESINANVASVETLKVKENNSKDLINNECSVTKSANNSIEHDSATMMHVHSANIKECLANIVDVVCKNKPNGDSVAGTTDMSRIENTMNIQDSAQTTSNVPAATTDEHSDTTSCTTASITKHTCPSSSRKEGVGSNSFLVVKNVIASVVDTVVKYAVEAKPENSKKHEDMDDEQMKLANELFAKYIDNQEKSGEDFVSCKSDNNLESVKWLDKIKQEPGEVDGNACGHSSPNSEKSLGSQETNDSAKNRAFWDLGLVPSGMNKPTREQIFTPKENGNDPTGASGNHIKARLLLDKPRGLDHSYSTSTLSPNDPMQKSKQGNLLDEVRKAPRPFDEVYGETETARKGLKRKRPSHPNRGPVNVSEKCLEPFQSGWMRELVYRATLDEGKARTADVYYYSPAKVKLRSYREIEDFLKTSKSSLTIENFSFAKSAIYHPPEEIVREAKRVGGRQSLSPKAPGSMPSLKLKLKAKKKLKRKFKKESEGDDDSPKKKIPRTYELINLPPDGTKSPFRLRLKKNVKRTPLRGGVEVVPCSLNCPGQKGILPSLHCGVCLCLYHPACVGCENNTNTFVCVKCISDRSHGRQHSKENDPSSKDDYSSGDPPLALQVKAELLLDDDSSSPTKETRPQISDSSSSPSSPSTPLRALPKLIQMPPTCTATSPIVNAMRPPPPLQKAPGISLVNKAAGATWMPPSGLPPHTKQLPQQPPPLRLGGVSNLQPVFVTNGIHPTVPNRPPPPLMIRPMTSAPNSEHVPPSILSMFAVRPQTTVTVASVPNAPLRLANPVMSGGAITIVRPSQLVHVPAQQSSTSVAVPDGLLQRILTTVNQTATTVNTVTSSANIASGLTVNKVTPAKVVLPTTMPSNPKAVLVTMMNNTNSIAPGKTIPAATSVNSMKFTLKTNSGTTTEVLVPQVKPPAGSGPLQPKYIVVNKQGQPTGLVVGVGSTVIQLPILNQSASVTDPNKFLKDAVTASVKHPGVQETVSTVTATSSAMVAPKPVMQSVSAAPKLSAQVNSPQLTTLVVKQGTVLANLSTSVAPPAQPKITISPVDSATTTIPAARSAPAPVLLVPSSAGAPGLTKEGNDVLKNQKSLEETPQKPIVINLPAPKVARQRHPGANPSLCAMEKLMGGTKALLKIFKYLRQDDLSRASCVCRTWRWLASQTEKWKCIKLNGIQVCDWDRLVEIIKRHASTRLDMRGMKTFEDKNRTWHGFAAALQDLSCIHRIDFGQVPVSILHTVANSLIQLEVLTAEWITDIGKEADCANSNCRLDVGKFGQLNQLKMLRLRGVRGIQLPTFTLSRGLSSLSSLNKLMHLSLTTLKDVPPNEFDFLTSLTQLETLEIGDCTLWEDEHYDYLTSLSNLKMLRLECSSPEAKQGLSQAIEKLKQLQHLELYNVAVDQQLLDGLKELRLLSLLSLWPHEDQDGATVNTAVFVSVGQLVQLQQFTWGLATEDCRVTNSEGEEELPKASSSDTSVIEIGSDDEGNTIVEDGDETQNDAECIPFLLTEVTSEDSEYLREFLGFKELDHRLRRKLHKTTLRLHPLNSPIIHSRISISK